MLLNDAVLRELYARRGRTYAPESIIFLENDSGDEMYIIVNGEVEISKMHREQEIFSGATLHFGTTPEVVAILGPGDFFGEMALWNDMPRMATARARTQVEAIVFGKDDIEMLVMRSPQLALQMLRSMSHRLREVSKSPRLELVLPQLREAFRELHAAAKRRAAGGADARGEAATIAAPKPRTPASAPPEPNPAAVAAAAGRVRRSCTACGEPARPRDRFCAQCGQRLDGGGSSRDADAPSAAAAPGDTLA